VALCLVGRCDISYYLPELHGNLQYYMKREDQQDATIRCLLLTSMSLMSLFRPMDHYNDIGHVSTNGTLQLNV